MMMLPADACRRLRQCVLLLGSPEAGEVVAAAGAIGRTLATHGRTWHDLADALASPAVSAPPGDPTAAVLAELAGRVTRPSDREWIARLRRYYARHGRLSERQMQVLVDIASRHGC